MTEAKYTPGPWKAVSDVKNAGCLLVNPAVESKLGTPICRIDLYSDAKNDQRQANASLIAAAPELLEALQSVLAWCHSPTDTRTTSDIEDIVVSAIAKARGQKAGAA